MTPVLPLLPVLPLPVEGELAGAEGAVETANEVSPRLRPTLRTEQAEQSVWERRNITDLEMVEAAAHQVLVLTGEAVALPHVWIYSQI